jgi:nucleoside-diphosphate-sugar epimerase
MAVMGFATALLHRAGEPLTIPCFTGVMGAGRHHGEAAASAANQHDEAGDAVSGSDGAAAASSREDGQQNAAVGMSRRRGLLRHEARMAVTRAHTAQQHAGDSITGLPAPPVGCIPPYRDFTAVSDVVRGILAACGTTAAAAPGQHRVLNLGRGQPQSIMTLLALLQQLTGRRATRVTFKAVPAGRGNADVLFTWADMTRASAALGVTPHVDLADGLQEVVDALLAAPQPL